MIDNLIKDGDVYTDSSGAFVRISGTDELFQRAYICICVNKGSFAYDRTLGSDIRKINLNAQDAAEKLQLVINEALINCDGVCAKVLETGKSIKVELCVNDVKRTAEVVI